MPEIIITPLAIIAILCFMCMFWKFYRDDKNYITEKEWKNFTSTLNYLYIKEGLEHYGPFYSRYSFKEVEIGDMSIRLMKEDYSFKRHF